MLRRHAGIFHPSLAAGPDAGVTLQDLKNALRRSNIYALQDGRYYVALSLAEAGAYTRPLFGSTLAVSDTQHIP
jgi:hypothetical protein